ncbi:MAPEG family protein [Sulfurirhabdus autotrophica]|uniref:Putative MAPEG superfamily protein n=1 Tax=Sulfurirhabdus autotrophica TaxID=1706046 RepID=A0A4R3XYD1_9PROT|nr:MAPEG family protein [Sulfurirhabdus autotrophica]TCV84077.1 putative MAPEG superfamily protein [Sulfurirhabdus autotrophica]
MSIAYWCIFISGLLPFFWSMSWRWPVYSLTANLAPRSFEVKLSGWRLRAHWAHLNAIEAFPQFAVAVIVAQQFHVSQSIVDELAIAFVIFRVVHGLFYLADLGVPRTLAFAGGGACTIALFLLAI